MSEQSEHETQSTSVPPFYAVAKEERSRYFFLRRRPKLRMMRDWERPPEPQYQAQLAAEGFITEDLVQETLKQTMSDELRIELRELDQHLLPHFWRLDQQAKYYQNRHFQYQWTFILTAFLTTALAAASVFAYAQQGEESSRLLQSGLSLATAIVSGIAATVSFLDANQTPQRRWFRARAQAESLRSLYFLFIARQPPFDLASISDRVERLRQKVVDVLTEMQPRERNAAQSAQIQPTLEPEPLAPLPETPEEEEDTP